MNIDTTPDTIVLIHGLWMTPRSWEKWVPYFEARGYRVVTPTYPGFEGEVEALREDPSPIAKVSLPETIEHLEKVVAALDKSPILMGHSLGGLLVQLLLDRGHGAAGVAIDSAPPEGVRTTPLQQVKALFPVLNPVEARKAVGFTAEQFHYAFGNTLTEEESLKAYERYHIAAPGPWLWRYALLANVTPGHQDAWVNYKNNDRAPLLFIAGGVDHVMPPSVNRSNAKHYEHSTAQTYFYEFPDRSHFTCGEPGWEDVADYALTWAASNATPRPVRQHET